MGKEERKTPLGGPRRGRRIILKWILEKEHGMLRTEFIWFWIRTTGALL
jgi:hypothetical protein